MYFVFAEKIIALGIFDGKEQRPPPESYECPQCSLFYVYGPSPWSIIQLARRQSGCLSQFYAVFV